MPTDLSFWPDSTGPIGKLDGGTPFPRWVDYRVFRGDKPDGPIVHLRLEIVEGQPAVTAFGLGGSIVKASDLRDVPFAEIAKQATELAARAAAVTLRAVTGSDTVTLDELNEIADQAGAHAIDVGGRRVVSDKLLEKVAQIYRINEANGNPTQQVANQLNTSHRNATRWVAIARERGLLSPYKEGK